MVDENKDRRGNPSEGVGTRIGEDIKAMASADETGSAVTGQGVDASLAPDTGRRLKTRRRSALPLASSWFPCSGLRPLPWGPVSSCRRSSIPCMESALKRLWGQ